jgi:hypothetical protein
MQFCIAILSQNLCLRDPTLKNFLHPLIIWEISKPMLGLGSCTKPLMHKGNRLSTIIRLSGPKASFQICL